MFRIYVAILLSAMVFMVGATAGQAFAQDIEFVERPENEFLILALHVNGVERDEGIIAYLPTTQSPDKVLVPLGAFADALSFAIDVNPGNGMAEGWFIDESRIFQLDLKRDGLIVAGETLPLPPKGAEPHIDDIYVRAHLLEQWFNADIKLDLSSLRLYIDTDYELPFQEQRSRRARGQKLGDKDYFNSFKAGDADLLPYKMLTLPHFVFQQSGSVNRDPENTSYSSSSSLQARFDFLGFGTRFLLSTEYDNKEKGRIENAELTFQRRDPRKSLLGPFRAGKVALGDVNFPDVPLFQGKQRGRGIAVSSSSQLDFNFTQNIEQFILDGDAPIGWDIELYRNGHFIDFQAVGDDGRYRFENVRLLTGMNLFEIRLFGPEGQKETRTRRVLRGSEMLPEGNMRYNFAVGQPRSDFLPIVKDREDEQMPGASGQVFYGFHKHLTLGSSFFTGPEEKNFIKGRSSAVTLSAISSFLGINTELQAMFADKNRRSYEAEIRTQYAQTNISLRHRENKGFIADDRDLIRRTEISLSRNFDVLNATLVAEKRSFQRDEPETFVAGVFSADFLGIKLTNELEKVFSKRDLQERFDGELSILTSLFDYRLRSNLNYNLDNRAQDKLESARFSAFRDLGENETLRITGQHRFRSQITTLNARYSRSFGPYNIDFSLGASSNDNYQAGLTFRTALQPDAAGHYNQVDIKEGSLTNLGLRSFIDKNGNGRFDNYDEPIDGVVFKASRGNAEAQTDEEGLAHVSGLTESPTRFAIDKETIPSIYLDPVRDKVDLIPRKGANEIIDFPFRQLGEIDGFVYSRGNTLEERKPASNVLVKIINRQSGEELDTTRTAYDGYYLFSSLPLGEYEIIVQPSWKEKESDMPSRLLTLTTGETFRTNINFVVRRDEAKRNK